MNKCMKWGVGGIVVGILLTLWINPRDYLRFPVAAKEREVETLRPVQEQVEALQAATEKLAAALKTHGDASKGDSEKARQNDRLAETLKPVACELCPNK